ncbi:MAG TPA: hypothetical protein VNB23_02595 [Ramlibacter sp.]|nr:hypothetical protein [Ramlibacter sp.]
MDAQAATAEILPADRRFRVQAAVTVCTLLVVGAVVVVLFDQWLLGVRQLPPEQAATRVLAAYLAWSAACGVALLVLAAVLWRSGNEVIAAARFPAPGTRVLRDTPVLEGEAAVRRGRLLRVLAGAVAGCVVVLAGMAVVMAQRLAP